MHPIVEINLNGEILPVSLLKCKRALDALNARERLIVKTDDPIVADNVIKFIRSNAFQVIRHDKTGKGHTVHIAKD